GHSLRVRLLALDGVPHRLAVGRLRLLHVCVVQLGFRFRFWRGLWHRRCRQWEGWFWLRDRQRSERIGARTRSLFLFRFKVHRRNFRERLRILRRRWG